MMNAYVLEVVVSSGCRKGGKTFWTEKSAKLHAEHLVRTGKADSVRILQVSVRDESVAAIPHGSEVAHD